MRFSGLGLHVGKIHDGAIVSDKRSGQRQQCVLHPEALLRGLFKDEDHAFVLWHRCAVHQPDLSLLGCRSDLGVYLVHAGAQRYPGEVDLGGVLGEHKA